MLSGGFGRGGRSWAATLTACSDRGGAGAAPPPSPPTAPGMSRAGACSGLCGEHAYGDVDGFEHALGVGDALPGAVEGGAVVHRDAQERQAHRDVDAGEPGPRPALLVVVEAEGLHRHVALVVVHRDHDVELAAPRAREERVRGQGAVHVEALTSRVLDRGDDLRLLLVAEEPVLARVRVEPAHRDAGPRPPEAGHGLLRELDDAAHALAR